MSFLTSNLLQEISSNPKTHSAKPKALTQNGIAENTKNSSMDPVAPYLISIYPFVWFPKNMPFSCITGKTCNFGIRLHKIYINY